MTIHCGLRLRSIVRAISANSIPLIAQEVAIQLTSALAINDIDQGFQSEAAVGKRFGGAAVHPATQKFPPTGQAAHANQRALTAGHRAEALGIKPALLCMKA